MSKRDYYEVLGVDNNSSEDEIKRAYRKQAIKFHPDKNPDDKDAEMKFKEVGEAYAILADEQKRAQYDRFGHAASGAGGFGGGFQGAEVDPFEIFRSFMNGFGGGGFSDFGFGGTGARSRSTRGREMQLSLKLTLEEIAAGANKKIKIKKLVHCDVCSGSGSKPGSSPKTCPVCRGTGEIRRSAMGGFFTQVAPCDSCRGSGKIISDPCPSCRGDGRNRGETTVSVNIPAGVTNGNYILLRGQGNAGPNSGPDGDIKVFIEEIDHEFFERDGDDLLYRLQISFPQAALGDSVLVPTLNGKAKLTIPSGTEAGKIFRMKGKGIKHLNGYGTGDQLVIVQIYTPKKLSTREQELLKELSECEGIKPQPSDKGFFKKVKDAFF